METKGLVLCGTTPSPQACRFFPLLLELGSVGDRRLGVQLKKEKKIHPIPGPRIRDTEGR